MMEHYWSYAVTAVVLITGIARLLGKVFTIARHDALNRMCADLMITLFLAVALPFLLLGIGGLTISDDKQWVQFLTLLPVWLCCVIISGSWLLDSSKIVLKDLIYSR